MRYDVVIYGSTPAGIIAAIAASGQGRRACIVTPDPHVGGLQTSGLGNTNAGNRGTVGGLMREFHRRVLAFYVSTYGAESEQVAACQDGYFFEPHVAEHIYGTWLADHGVDVMTMREVSGAETRDRRIIALPLGDGSRIEGRVFIDASYEGDLIAWAGGSYRVGRESRDEYGEPLAGVRFPAEEEGTADTKTQGYDFRLCLTDVPGNRVPFRRPDTYDPGLYAALRADLRARRSPVHRQQLLPINVMPNRKTDSRTGEWTGGSWEYPEASPEVRRHIVQKHREYTEGYVWFLLTDDAVPQDIRDEVATYGYAKDEFADNDHWPYQIYVREARRLVGDVVMTQADVTESRFKPDGVALGNFFLDVHPVRFVPAAEAPAGFVPEGGLGERVRPHEIPYRALLPKRAELANVLVPLNISASHVAFSTIRMEPVYGMLGHAAGLAAAMSIEQGVALHDLPTDALRGQLREQGQVLDAAVFTEAW